MWKTNYIELESYLDLIASKIINPKQYTFFEEFKDELNYLLNEERPNSRVVWAGKWFVHDVNEKTADKLVKEFNKTAKSPYEFATSFLLNI